MGAAGGPEVPFPLLFGSLGFLGDITFSGVLGILEGRRRFGQLSLPRVVGWGAIAGLLLSASFVLAVALGGDDSLDLLEVGPVLAVAGALSTAGALAVARRASARERFGASPDAT